MWNSWERKTKTPQKTPTTVNVDINVFIGESASSFLCWSVQRVTFISLTNPSSLSPSLCQSFLQSHHLFPHTNLGRNFPVWLRRARHRMTYTPRRWSYSTFRIWKRSSTCEIWGWRWQFIRPHRPLASHFPHPRVRVFLYSLCLT